MAGVKADVAADDGPADSAALNRRLRKMYREMKLAQGVKVPDSPPPPPPPPTPAPSKDPLVRSLLDAGGTVVYKKLHTRLIKHACGIRITKYSRDGLKPGEADAMRFVAQNTTISVPAVYDAGRRARARKSCASSVTRSGCARCGMAAPGLRARWWPAARLSTAMVRAVWSRLR